MFLQLLVPVVLLFPVLALVVESSSLRSYRGTWVTELLALLLAIVIYFGVWLGLHAAIRGATGSTAIALVASSLLSLFTLYPGLRVGFAIFRVRAMESEAGAH